MSRSSDLARAILPQWMLCRIGLHVFATDVFGDERCTQCGYMKSRGGSQ